jgi:hypothetical protein
MVSIELNTIEIAAETNMQGIKDNQLLKNFS